MNGDYTGSRLLINYDDLSNIASTAKYANKLRNNLRRERLELIEARHRPLLHQLDGGRMNI
jgi:hypothetical protein